MKHECDFHGWATKNDVRCSDGRTIKRDAFKDCDGMIVPLVYQHQHDDITNVLGHALLENRAEGVYTYCSFNDTANGQEAKKAVAHGDITSLSIYANKLKQIGGDVVHGMIREVSLVLAGANPEARIVDFNFAHNEEGEGEAIIYTGKADFNMDDKNLQHAEEGEAGGKTVQDVFNSMSEEQKNVVYFLIGQALEEAGAGDDEAAQMDEEGDNSMKHNVFDNSDEKQSDTLSHADINEIFEDAKKNGSLKAAVEAHGAEFFAHSIDGQDDTVTETYGIHDIDYLFPDYKNIDRTPFMINHDVAWVSGWLSGVSKNPFSRIKMMYADITADEARAKGYLKGHRKKDEVFKLLKRVVGPTTIYKKQKFDRDDIIDITDFDVVSYVKSEMRGKLDEEIAMATLFGDGRDEESEDKIDETCIIPVVKDDDFYTKKLTLDASEWKNLDVSVAAVKLVDYLSAALLDYKGTGLPNLYMDPLLIRSMLLARDSLDHRLWKTKAELATEIGVNNIIEVEQIKGKEVNDTQIAAIMVNPKDYVIGADKGGSINMFDDFDIDFNQYKYLMETRCSGALRKPQSAVVVLGDLTQVLDARHTGE